MKFQVAAVGHRMPTWIDVGFDEYARRLPRGLRIELTEIKPAVRTASPSKALVKQWQTLEVERIRAAMPAHSVCVVLDERGKGLTTAALARQIERWRQEARDVVFVIGGADGTTAELQQSAALLWSLSPLTLPHGLCRVILAEQIYRAVSLLAGHPYHRE
jgi:23S rRNA (pseudouridine1915-N3)-methyltransferase